MVARKAHLTRSHSQCYIKARLPLFGIIRRHRPCVGIPPRSVRTRPHTFGSDRLCVCDILPRTLRKCPRRFDRSLGQSGSHGSCRPLPTNKFRHNLYRAECIQPSWPRRAHLGRLPRSARTLGHSGRMPRYNFETCGGSCYVLHKTRVFGQDLTPNRQRVTRLRGRNLKPSRYVLWVELCRYAIDSGETHVLCQTRNTGGGRGAGNSSNWALSD